MATANLVQVNVDKSELFVTQDTSTVNLKNNRAVGYSLCTQAIYKIP